MKKIVSISSFLFLLYACSTSDSSTEVATVTLSIEKELGQLSDNSYIADIRSMDFKDNQFYLADYTRNELLVLSEDLVLKNTIGNGGEGPGEFRGAGSITVSDDFIYAVNDGKQTVEVFKGDIHIKTINPQIMLGGGTSLRFGVIKDTFYFSDPESQNSISQFTSDHKISSFGEIHKFPNLSQTLLQNYTHVLMHSNGMISISDNLPVITFYDLNKNKLSTLDYSDIPIIQEHMDFLERNPTEENSYYILATDAHVFSDTLYVLLTLQSDKGPVSNKVLEIKVNKNGELLITRILDLGEGWFTALCANKTDLLSFNTSTGNLMKFQL
ncbi:hypothetical protein ACFO3O_11490 [Dokdonia ponticola]|uniref:6-bladed beta-propeller n=1 Tax=Dokdonia ponticola TaxID=2041041 RepID=A0ABV9HZN4_9FLAO